MKKLIAGLMLLLMFVNVASAENGVAPDAKTLDQLKDMGKKYSKQLNLNSITGWKFDNTGKSIYPVGVSGFWIEIGYDGVLKGLSADVPLDGDENIVDVGYDIKSGKPDYFYVRDSNGNIIRINGHYGFYNTNGDLLGTVDPNNITVKAK
ncbi:MAG: hypothetical protein Ta2C_08000 [Candidatus Endomicrobiellum trichonymphae]|uniref:hypothetical protein n=1 Tax=Endomicrobium trichonymphae TaxID=1408204 RepID=UPI0027D3A910|nr:MAG: hypothetical protein Ta2C_08000 [Candidatus Endomicrobium trichonymphae]